MVYLHGFGEKWIIKRFDYIVAIIPVLKADLVSKLSLNPNKIQVPLLGMDSSFD